jgi:high-affinity iron transporter
MLSSAVIVFREVMEAALIIGIIAATTRGLPGRNRWLFIGIGTGVLGSLIVAALTGRIADLAEGMGQELFNAGILTIAAGMLAWHNIWMARHGIELARDARQLGRDVASGGREMSALALVVALAILREGSETALFLYGLIASGSESLLSIFGGSILGLGLGALAGFGLYAGFLNISTRMFFAATSAVILFLTAAMASQVARLLIQADYLPSLATPVWDTSSLLENHSLLGQLLHTLIGYEASPSGMQVVFYSATLILVMGGMRLFRSRPHSHSSLQETAS